MKKILLVRPEESRTKYDFKGIIENEPLDLEIIKAILNDSYDVTIFDLQIEKISFKDFIDNNCFDVLYIEGRCFQETFMLEYAEDFKKKYGNMVIIGGQHAQINKERFFSDNVDYVLSGYNYYDLDKILENNIEGIFNLSYHANGQWHSSPKKETDINDLPLADRTYFYDHPDNYQYLDMKHAMWLRTAFSCPYKCRFCIRRLMNDSTYSRRDVNAVVDEIENNDNEIVYIVDDDFLVDRGYIIKFIDQIRRRNISRRYICYSRSDFIVENEDIMKQLKELGFDYILVGLEDIRDSKLDLYNKLNTVDKNERCIEICHKYGLRLMAMFILGLDFRYRDFKDLYKYIRSHDLKHVAVSIYTPELGINNSFEYITDDPSHFDYLHLVAKPAHISVSRYYVYYYVLLIRLFIKGYRDGIYDFIDYGEYIRSFIKNILNIYRNG